MSAKQIEQVLDAVAGGCSTSPTVAESIGASIHSATGRLRELELLGLIERTGRYLRVAAEGRPAIEWRIKSGRRW